MGRAGLRPAFPSGNQAFLFCQQRSGAFYCLAARFGRCFDFYSRINGLEFKETLEQLANEAGVTIDRGPRDPQRDGQERKRARRQPSAHVRAGCRAFCLSPASPQNEECRRYIEKRGLSDEMVERFGLGWARREWRSLADALRRAGTTCALAAGPRLVGQSAGSHTTGFRGRLIFPSKSLKPDHYLWQAYYRR